MVATPSGAAAERWTLRLRGPKGTPASLELPNGGNTTVADLITLAGKATRVAAARLVLKTGFPPRELRPSMDKGDDDTVQAAGVVNRDALHVDRRPADSKSAGPEGGGSNRGAGPAGEGVVEGAGPLAAESTPNPTNPSNTAPSPARTAAGTKAPASSPSTPAPLRSCGAAAGTPVSGDRPKGGSRTPVATSAPKRKRRRVGRMPGVGQRLGDGSEQEPTTGEPETEGPTLGRARNAMDSAEAALASDLLTAVGGGDGTVRSVHKSLRGSLREARKALGAEADALEKVSAALSGRVEFRDLADGTGRVEAAYSVGNRGVVKRELVNGIPPVLLPAILNLVASDPDPVSRKNLKVEAMAIVSPRMFWAIVRHGGVGPGRSFAEALAALVPQIDWEAIEARDRQRPERYADYVSH